MLDCPVEVLREIATYAAGDNGTANAFRFNLVYRTICRALKEIFEAAIFHTLRINTESDLTLLSLSKILTSACNTGLVHHVRHLHLSDGSCKGQRALRTLETERLENEGLCCALVLLSFLRPCTHLETLDIVINCVTPNVLQRVLPPLSSQSRISLAGESWESWLPALSRQDRLREIAVDFTGDWLAIEQYQWLRVAGDANRAYETGED